MTTNTDSSLSKLIDARVALYDDLVNRVELVRNSEITLQARREELAEGLHGANIIGGISTRDLEQETGISRNIITKHIANHTETLKNTKKVKVKKDGEKTGPIRTP